MGRLSMLAFIAYSRAAAVVANTSGDCRNKVLKLTGLAQIRRINLAQAQAASKDTASIQAALADTEKKLATNIAIVGFISFLCMPGCVFRWD